MSAFSRSVTTTSHYRPYQLECPTCREVAALHERADLLQPQMDRILPRSPYLHDPTRELTPQQRSAVDWSFAISSCLRRGMEFHARCAACTILMGPGHAEPGIDGFCQTHSDSEPPPPVAVNVAPDDVLAWIAGSGGRSAQI